MSARIGSQTLMRQTQRLLQAGAQTNNEGKVPDDGSGAIVKHLKLAPIMEGAITEVQMLCERAHSAERCALGSSRGEDNRTTQSDTTRKLNLLSSRTSTSVSSAVINTSSHTNSGTGNRHHSSSSSKIKPKRTRHSKAIELRTL